MSDAVAFSNGIRLSLRQWLGVLVFTLAFVFVCPWLWDQFEKFPFESDYRMPHELGNDYWLYKRYAELAVQHHDVMIVGDSVVWGEYVTRQETLSHYLNKLAGQERFANLGLGGAHQLALIGLMDQYAGSVRYQKVVLLCNPLWMSSPEADLSDVTDKPKPIHNHERLIPQFVPRVPRLRADVSTRLGILVEQRFFFSQWTHHLQQAYYGGADLPKWTLEHPYENPLAPLMGRLPPSGNELRFLQEPWFKKNKTKSDYEWIDPPEASLQWQAFGRVVEILQRRGNRVFVVIGPLNEHMLTPKSLGRYRQVKGMIRRSLEAKKVPHMTPAVLPSEQYADASHPLPEGYAILARQLWQDPGFRAAMAP